MLRTIILTDGGVSVLSVINQVNTTLDETESYY
jgi:hypothetical protein